MPTHKVFVRVIFMSTEHTCAKREDYNALWHLDKELHGLCGGMFWGFFVNVFAFNL